MQDYAQIVRQHADALGAKIVDIRSDEAADDFGHAMQILQAIYSGLTPEEAAFSDTHTKELFVDTDALKTELGCFIAMHELGHIATTPDGTPSSLEVEAKATKWALDNVGFAPSKRTAKFIEEALHSYDPDGGAGPVTKQVEQALHALQQPHAQRVAKTG